MDLSKGFISPNTNRGALRRPFGELTNTPPGRYPLNEVTPQKQHQHPGTSNCEAHTPTANLKLLSNVAIERTIGSEFQSKRTLFQEESNENNLVSITDHGYSSDAQSTTGSRPSSISTSSSPYPYDTPTLQTQNAASSGQKVSRKEKSLGLLCDKFISNFPEAVPPNEKCEIPLDDLAKKMNTERRRIYDIVNVLEAIQMMTKVGKNLYQWHGKAYQLPTLGWLKQLAVKFNFFQRYLNVKRMEMEENVYGNLSPRIERDLRISPMSANSSLTNSPGSISSASPSPSPCERKTSLGVACQKFLMLFLILPESEAKISLELAAKIIHGVAIPDSTMKTRIRRLYDIANILQSLKLIQKIQITEPHGGKKPAFQYIGPKVDHMEITKDILKTLPSIRQKNSLLTFGKNLFNLPDEPETENSSAYKENMGSRKRFHSEERVGESDKKLVLGYSNVKSETQTGSRYVMVSPEAPLVRSESAPSALNLVKRTGNFRLPNRYTSSPNAPSLLSLKQGNVTLSTQRQLFKSPINSRGSIISPSSSPSNDTKISLLKKALTVSPSSVQMTNVYKKPWQVQLKNKESENETKVVGVEVKRPHFPQ